MTPMISPPVMTNAGPPAAQAGTRGRGTDEAQGFGAALERSRANNAGKADTKPKDEASNVAAADRKPARKPGADEKTNEDALPADPNLAFLGTAHTPLHALTLAGRTAAQRQQGERVADATAAAATTADLVAGIPLDPALQAASAKALPDAAQAAADASATPEAALAAKDAAPKAAPAAAAATPFPIETAPADSLHEIARAAIAAQTMAVGMTKPASAPAGTPVVATAGRTAASRMPMSATTAEQLASAAQPAAAEDTQAKAASTPASAIATVDHADTDASVAPIALQQPATVTASSSDRANDTAATRAPVHTIAPEVGSEKWAPALGQQLARMSTSGHHTAELNLNPAGLGPLKVTLSMGDNQAQAMFVSAHESVRKAVEAALPQLRNSLSEQGITLGQASVGAETRQPTGQDAAFAQQQNQQQQQNAARQQTASYPGAGRAAATAPATPVAATRTGLPGNAASGVDTFA